MRTPRRRTIPLVILPVVAGLAGGAGTPAGAERTGDRPVWPVPGALSRDFDPPAQDWLPGHRGIDVDTFAGTAVTSPREGVVAHAGTVAGTPVVVISHGAARATYQPVVAALAPGTPVAAGQVIGTVASGGHCADRCLHWGLVVDEQYLDPRLLLGRPRVVLVPVPD